MIAFMKVAEALVFSKDSIKVGRELLLDHFDHLNKRVFKNSVQWGEEVASVILDRASKDKYKLTRGMPKFSVLKETGIWQQTPPDYEEAVEPNWRLIQPLLMDSASQFKPARPPAYDLNPSSQYYKEVKEVFELSHQLTEEQKLIARFWDDNPFVSEHKGHLTYGNKKMTPVGHWMGITGLLCKQTKKTPLEIARTYALTAAAIFDGFIATWEEKYTSKTVRPVTVIREHIASEWNPLLQTPPFPEYTSGHSVISAAAATVLTAVIGNQVSFRDTTELKYLGLERHFPSLEAASDEVSMSRMYGGIHYRSAVMNGQKQGQQIGTHFIKKFLHP
jgi:membrane-associated phospholipid phosphatase